MNIYQFMSDSPWLSFFIAACVCQVVCVFFHYGSNLLNRTFRHWNIRKHGYPPAHCDADGDFKPLDIKEEIENE